MDWFSWLSKTHLEPLYIHEYAVAFSHNQLEEDDISYFNHEFLQSMGISIAKHRLEILKLARKSSGSHPIARLMSTIKKTKTTLARYVHTWVHRNDSAMVMVKKRSYSSRWKEALVKRSNRLVKNNKQQGSATLLITNGYRPVVRSGTAKVNSFSGSLVYDLRHDNKEDSGKVKENLYSDNEDDGGYGGGDDGSDGGGYFSGGGVEVIKWDTMFQNLKPT